MSSFMVGLYSQYMSGMSENSQWFKKGHSFFKNSTIVKKIRHIEILSEMIIGDRNYKFNCKTYPKKYS